MTKNQPSEILMHNTRLFPKNTGAASYRPGGIAERCDWIVLTDVVWTDGELRGDGCLRKTVSRMPGTIFLSMRSCFHALPFFYEEVLPGINVPFILISGSEDFTLPNQLDSRWRSSSSCERDLVRKIAGDERVIHWFAENRDEELPKMSTLPVGYVFTDEPANIVKLTPPALAIKDRPLKVLCAHRVREGAQWANRRFVTELCRENFSGFSTILEDEINEDALEREIREHPFVLCVSGGGLDPSPKAWQCIANGSIPVIESSVLDDAYSQLPVAFVDDWTEDCLSVDKLQRWLDQLAPFYQPGPLRSETLHKLSLDYWWNRILEGRRY